MVDDLKDIPWRYPEIDLALLHLGGTRVLGVMVTLDAQQGVELMRIVNHGAPSPFTLTTTMSFNPRSPTFNVR